MATPMPEPAGGIHMWLDADGNPYAVFFKNPHDDYDGAPGNDCWFNTDQWDSDTDPMTWDEVSAEMSGLNGPHELVRVR